MVYVGIALIAFAPSLGVQSWAHSAPARESCQTLSCGQGPKEQAPCARCVAAYVAPPDLFSGIPQAALKSEASPIVPDKPSVEPEMYPRLVTVAELTRIVESPASSQSAGALARLQLTQRLSSPTLARLSSEVRSKEARSALMMLADASSFLEPPPGEIPPRPIPVLAEQKLILMRVADYLRATLPKLPDFFARRSSISFRDDSTSTKDTGNEKALRMKLVGASRATVYYRGGKEVVQEKGGQDHHLVTEGIFGPILAIVVSDAARSATTEWCRWENGPNGPMAVFRFHVSQSESHYHVRGFGDLGLIGPTAYHGEMGVDPLSGTILRLVLNADPALGSSITRADVMVEYGSVTIGGRVYTCPVKSVSYFVGALPAPMALGARSPRPTEQLNDVTFDDYHVFRAQMRILP